MVPASIPSPEISSIHIGFLTIHFYALCILLGMALAVWLTMRRWTRRGQDPDVLWDIVFWAVIGLSFGWAWQVFGRERPIRV